MCVCSVAQLCPIPCDPMDCSPPGSSIHGILQARTETGCHFLLQRIFPSQGLNPRVLCHLRRQGDSLPLHHCTGCVYPFKSGFSFSSDTYPGLGLLYHMVTVFLVFWGISILFSIMMAPICILINSVGGFPFFHILILVICALPTLLYLLKTHTAMGKTLPLFPLPGIFWKILLPDIPSALLSLRYLYGCHLMETFPKHLTQELPICAFP